MSTKHTIHCQTYWIMNRIDKRKHGMPITIASYGYQNIEFKKIDDKLNRIFTSIYYGLTISNIYVSKHNIQEKQIVFNIDGNVIEV